MSNLLPPDKFETEDPQENRALLQLLHELEFRETEEMLKLRPQVVEAMASMDQTAIRKLLGQYQALGEQAIDHEAPSDLFRSQNLSRKKRQIGLTLAVSLLWSEAGQVNKYGNNVVIALVYSKNAQFDNATKSIRSALARLIQPPSIEEVIRVIQREFSPEQYKKMDTLVALSPHEALEEIAEFMLSEGIEEQPYDFFHRVGWGEL